MVNLYSLGMDALKSPVSAATRERVVMSNVPCCQEQCASQFKDECFVVSLNFFSMLATSFKVSN